MGREVAEDALRRLTQSGSGIRRRRGAKKKVKKSTKNHFVSFAQIQRKRKSKRPRRKGIKGRKKSAKRRTKKRLSTKDKALLQMAKFNLA